MNYKKKSIILSFFIITIIQILLLINNRQKTSFRYFIWDVEEVSIGRLVCISFISGLLMSSLLNKTLHNDVKTFHKHDKNDKTTIDNDYSFNGKDNDESYEMPPERDLRESQPTISVNYRVINDNFEYELKDKNQASQKTEYNDDWNQSDTEW